MSRGILRLVLVVLLLMAADVAFRACSTSAHADNPPINGFVVKLKSGAQASGGWRSVYGLPGVYVVAAPTGKSAQTALDELKGRADVEYAHPNYVVTVEPRDVAEPDGVIAGAVNDPQIGQQYSLAKMSVLPAWDVSHGDGVVIAVVDTGVDFSHPDLAGAFVSRGRDFVNQDDDATDDQGHGTHVAGIVAARGNNGLGMAGVAYGARVLPVKVLGADGAGDHASIAAGLAWAADQGAKVINLSLGGAYGSQTLEAAVDYAWGKGALLTCAAGNNGSTNLTYPAAYAHCLAVAATDSQDRLASFSNYGSWVDVAAPGVQVLGTVRGGSYEGWNGTSMAAPNAAGVAALVAAAHPDWTNAQIRAALENTADRVLPAQAVRTGRLNARAAVGAGLGPSPTVAPQPTAATPNDYANQIEALINQTRAEYRLPPLRLDARLRAAADFHNRWMRDTGCFNHNCAGEPDVLARMRNAGYPVISGGENIGKGYQTPQDMLTGWLNSAGHRAAILNAYWPDLGCGYLRGVSGQPFDSYWSCEFGKASDGDPQPTVVIPPTRSLPATPTPSGVQPTPRPALPPEGWVFRIELQPSAGWALWDRAYYEICGRSGVTCTWYRR